MRNETHTVHRRAPLVLSATALVVAVLGTTPLGQAAGERLTAGIPFAKTAGYATLAGNATKLNGRRSTLTGAPGTIPVVGKEGRLPTSIGAVGPQGPTGPKGPRGEKGEKGASGPAGTSGYEVVLRETPGTQSDSNYAILACPAGKNPVGGGGVVVYIPPAPIDGRVFLDESRPYDPGTWKVGARRIPGSSGYAWKLVAYAICTNVAP